jgi:tape measure domain-containing protein
MSSRAIEAARAFVRIYADDSQLRKTLGGLKGQVQAAADAFSGVGGNIAFAGLAAAGGALVTTAADAERTAIAFEVMLGSAARAKQMLDQIYELGRTSPFGAQEFMRAGQVLLNFGLQADSILPTLRMIGDVAAGDSEKLSRLTLAFGQMSAAGRLMGQDLLQMVNAGFNPLQEISRLTGESMADLRKRMEAGGISAAEVSNAFKSATESGGRFSGMTQRLAGSTIGVWMTLKDEVMMLAKDMGRYLLPVVNMILTGVREVVSWFSGWGKAIVATGLAAAGFLSIMKLITLATIAFSKAQAMAIALTGPKGWAVLAGGLLAAASAYAVIDLTLQDVTASASASHAPVDTMSRDLKGIQSPALMAAAAIDDVAESARRATGAVADLQGPVQKVRKDVQDFQNDLAKGGQFGMILEGNPLVEQFREQKSGFSSMLADINAEIERLSGNATEASQKLAEMAAAGVAPAKLQELQTAITKRDGLLKAEENRQYWKDRRADLEAAADQVRQSIESVQQTFYRERQRLQSMVDAGVLSQVDADKFLAKNPKFAAIMQQNGTGEIANTVAVNTTPAQDLRSVSGAGQLTALFNNQQSVADKQLEVQRQTREYIKRLKELAEAGDNSVKI